MATGDTAARNERADNFATDYAAASLTIFDGTTPLATHTLTGFPAAVGGVLTANAIADVPASNTGTADSATLANGTGTYTLTVGLSGADLNLTTLDYVATETARINSLIINFPAS